MKRISLATLAFLGTLSLAGAATFYPITSISSSTSETDLWPASNLIQGPGVGFDAAEPHDKTAVDAAGNWVTADPGGFPSDYIAVAGAPVLSLDLGANQILGEISIWGYNAGNANGVSEFTLRFATEADGPGGFGTSVAYNPTFNGLLNDTFLRQSFDFSETVTARYVEFTATDNFFNDAGTPPGGDRVGLGEIAFEVIPEPSAAALIALGGLGLLLRRRTTARG